MQILENLLTIEEINYLSSLLEVKEALIELEKRNVVYLNINLEKIPDSIKNSLQKLGIDFSNTTFLPMRWIKGDTQGHIDRCSFSFQKTYLTYLTSSPGELIVDNNSYPIEEGMTYIFNEGINHETKNTSNIPRLLLGPMNEKSVSVGVSVAAITYYASETDANNDSNATEADSIYTVRTGNWKIANRSTGSSDKSIVYIEGDVLDSTTNAHSVYYLYPVVPCFLEGTKILCLIENQEKYIPVEYIRKDTLVKTSLNGYKKVELIGQGTINNTNSSERIEDRLYKLNTNKYPELMEDLYITGCHSILVDDLNEKEKELTNKYLGELFVTGNKFRLMACVDDRAEPWESEGKYKIWHFALENPNDKMNYGVYANGGLLVETCNIYFLKNKSNINLI